MIFESIQHRAKFDLTLPTRTLLRDAASNVDHEREKNTLRTPTNACSGSSPCRHQASDTVERIVDTKRVTREKDGIMITCCNASNIL